MSEEGDCACFLSGDKQLHTEASRQWPAAKICKSVCKTATVWFLCRYMTNVHGVCLLPGLSYVELRENNTPACRNVGKSRVFVENKMKSETKQSKEMDGEKLMMAQ